MENFRDVIEAWPDVATFAADVDVTVTLVRQWKSRNNIPSEHWGAIIRAARDRRIPRINADLFVRLTDRQAAA